MDVRLGPDSSPLAVSDISAHYKPNGPKICICHWWFLSQGGQGTPSVTRTRHIQNTALRAHFPAAVSGAGSGPVTEHPRRPDPAGGDHSGPEAGVLRRLPGPTARLRRRADHRVRVIAERWREGAILCVGFGAGYETFY